ncbi:LysR family transcriptional regulator [Sutterella sp.]|uniref:LysR family transcriptional regulator n=1 Tax=Sutterella sp. TaxID=1981025 RepID=UPI0026DF5242|nr:LysR family transcriptional regulator [Sutterella sp.]MDO5532808.1 LysR family transcriptional regulator [Sutterella sp.]
MPSNTCRYLNALLTEGSFSKAAQFLDISQPSLSQFLLRLETEIGTELIDRQVKPVRLTPAGELFLKTERQIDQMRETCAKQIDDIKAGVRGHVVVGASDYRETFFLTEVFPVFRRLFPSIELEVAEGRTKELEEMAMEGAVDFSLVISPLYHPQSLEVTEIYTEKLLVAMSVNHPVARRFPDTTGEEYPPLDFHELDRESFIVIKKGQMMNRLYHDLCERTGASPRVVLESESMIAALALASVSLGVTLTTETLARRSATAEPIRCFSISPEVPPRTVVAAYRGDRYLSKAARELIQVMLDVAGMKFQRG